MRSGGRTPINTPQISADGLTLFFTRQRAFQLYFAHRATRSAPWGNAILIEELRSSSTDASPFAAPDLLFLAFAGDRNGSFDLFWTGRTSTSGSWGTARPYSELNSSADDDDPWLSADRTVIYFDSTRSGGQGSRDIWMATRRSADAQFGTPTPVADLNTTALDGDPWLSQDGRRVYITSERDGTRHIFAANR